MTKEVRVRFAPSPTGLLNVGGVRSALYNYLFAKKHNGTFILRIEDTDQTRSVDYAEKYIYDAMEWLGLTIDEGPKQGGDYGPYRQSDRRDIYTEHIQLLLNNGAAYYAFDTPEELEKMREDAIANGVHTPKYDHSVRMKMKNSLTLSKEEVDQLIANKTPYIVRLHVKKEETISFDDIVRDKVSFQSNELDDKVLMKADGMPTYHFANIVDDKGMKISHVIRGEEWLSSTAHHVLLYRGFGWEDDMPTFVHLPLIMKPTGKGKLSKRDGAKFGFPVYPIAFSNDEMTVDGFREAGFLPDALINFLSFLGWNPGTEQEIFNVDELAQAFSLEKIVKAGARFDYDKAKWFNQQHIIKSDVNDLITIVQPMLIANGITADEAYIKSYITLMQERVNTMDEFVSKGDYFFGDITSFDQKNIKKRFKEENIPHFEAIAAQLEALESDANAEKIEAVIKGYISEHELSFGAILPILRLSMSGTMSGPDLFPMIALIGKDKCAKRLRDGLISFQKYKADA